MVEIKKVKCPENKIAIKCPYEMKPTRIVIHNTDNDAPAKNEIAYMHRNNNYASFHFAVDDKEIIQGIELNRNAFHSGDGANGKGNREGIAIEICYSLFGGKKFEQAQLNAAELTAKLLKDYGWDISKVTKHQDYSGKNCPKRTMKDYGWKYFLDLVQGFLTPKISVKKGDLVSIRLGAKYYNGKSVPSWVLSQKWYVSSISGDRAVINKNEQGTSSINSPINVSYLTVAKPTPSQFKVGSTVKLKQGAKTYTGGNLASFVYNRKHKIKQINGDRVVITYLGIVIAAVNIKDLTLV